MQTAAPIIFALVLLITFNPVHLDAQPNRDKGQTSKSAELSSSSDSRPIQPAALITNYLPNQSGPSSPSSLQTRIASPSAVFPKSPSAPLPWWTNTLGKGISEIETEDGDTQMMEPLPKALQNIMDLRMEPCEDFETFATGRGPFVDPWKIMSRLHSQMSVLIMLKPSDEPNINANDIISKNIYNFYRSCMQRGESMELSKKRFLKLIADLGGCPLMQWELGWDMRQGDSNLRFVTSMIRLFKMDLMDRQPISLEVVPDPDEPSRTILHIGQPKEELTLAQAPRSFTYEKIKLLDLGISQLESFEMIDEVYKFVKALKEVRTEPKTRRVNLDEFAKKYPGIDWKHLVRDLTGQSGNVQMLISNEDYLSLLEKLIAASDKRFGPFLHEQLAQGTGKVNCLSDIHGEMTLPLAIEFKKSQDQAYLGDTLIKANYLAEAIRSQVELSLRRATWMTDKSRQIALEKLSKMKMFIGLTSSDESNYDENLALDQYGNYKLDENSSFIDNYLLIRQQMGLFKLNELRKPTRNAAEWSRLKFKPTLRVHYIQEANAIDIPMALLSAPFFDTNQPEYMNFGSLGYMISRAILKAFDLHGSHYDSNGIYGNGMYDSVTRREYLLKVRSYLRNSLIPLASAIKTLSDDVSDLGASKLAFAAYENELVRRNSNKLDSSSQLDNNVIMNPRQLFFVSLAANMACCHEQHQDESHLSDDMPNTERINQIFRYMGQFNQLFNCKINNSMKFNDKVPIDIW